MDKPTSAETPEAATGEASLPAKIAVTTFGVCFAIVCVMGTIKLGMVLFG